MLELLEELEQLLELEELELELRSPPKISPLLEELLELELLEQVLEGTSGLKGVVRSAPQPCNKIMAQKHNRAEMYECDWWRKKLFIRVQIFQKSLFHCCDIGN